MQILYVDYDVTMSSYVAICDDDCVIMLGASTMEEAEQEADEIMLPEVLHDEC